MPAPSLRNLSLGALQSNPQTLKALLAENESLFVEHKTDIAKGDGYQISKAAASFANTLGGWILVGVNDNGPIANWKPPAGSFVDAVRQRFEGQLDPIPSFAADTVKLKNGPVIGVVRVYESADTPHILLADGSVVVREPAQDTKLRKLGRYEATPIRSHYELVRLAQRGQQAEEAAKQLLNPDKTPWIEHSIGTHQPPAASFQAVSAGSAGVVLRAAPLTVSSRWREWSVSKAGVDALADLVEAIVDRKGEVGNPKPHPCGVAITSQESNGRPWVPGGHRHVLRYATGALDSAGVIGLRLGFEMQSSSGNLNDWKELGDGSEPRALVESLLERMSAVLAKAEHLGRYAVQLSWIDFGTLYRVNPSQGGEGAPPAQLPGGGLLTVDGLPDANEREALALQWSHELLRASGVPIWIQS